MGGTVSQGTGGGFNGLPAVKNNNAMSASPSSPPSPGSPDDAPDAPLVSRGMFGPPSPAQAPMTPGQPWQLPANRQGGSVSGMFGPTPSRTPAFPRFNPSVSALYG